KKLAGAIYKALVEKYLLAEYRESQPAVKPQPKRLAPATPPAEAEIAFSMREVRDIYDNPGPFLKNRRQETTFEQHVEQVYLTDGFVIEQRAGEEWLVKRTKPPSPWPTGVVARDKVQKRRKSIEKPIVLHVP
nr:hypothetical protein [Tanacetum cinerariifolium]